MRKREKGTSGVTMKKKGKTAVRVTTALMTATVLLLTVGCGNSSTTASTATTASANETTATTQADTITSFEDVATSKVSLIALGNSDVPVGQYSEEIFTNMGIWDQIQSKISFGTNVKEVLSQVSTGSVDCGVVYATDAATATGVKVVSSAPSDMLQTPVIYPAAVLTQSTNQEAAKVFLDYLLTSDAKTQFEKVGFKMATDKSASNLTTTQSCTLNVYAAASLKESLTAIQTLFEAKYPNIKLSFNFDSSGTLLTQIEQGAPADIFISAAQKQMNTLDTEGYVDSTTRMDLLENEVVLIVPED